MITQFRFGHATRVAMHPTDIALAGVDPELGNIEQSHSLAFLFQMVFDLKSKLGGFRDIGGVLVIPIARGQQEDGIPRFEILDES
jgi:hypothetical protein